jgi:glycerate 2-kinase
MTLQDLARHLTAVALAAVDPERLAREELSRRSERFGSVVAMGKAGAAFARGVGEGLEAGARRLLIRPHRSPGLLDPGWEQTTGGHPLSDRQSVAAGERLERWLGEIPPRPLLALISGGASACLELPAPGLTLEDLVATQQALLASGLPIQTVNAVRKHLSRLKGGGALRATGGRLPRILALLLSDVPGDDPSAIASGPFAADPTTFTDALEALQGLTVPGSVRRHLEAGARGEIPETVKPGDPSLERVETVLLGSVGTAVAAVKAEVLRQGFQAEVGGLEGEAARAGRDLVARGRALTGNAGFARVLGGETTVTLGPAPGSGGRNQELALAAARELAGGEGELVLTLATDGEDGPTRYAGAVVTGATCAACGDRSRGRPGPARLPHRPGRGTGSPPGDGTDGYERGRSGRLSAGSCCRASGPQDGVAWGSSQPRRLLWKSPKPPPSTSRSRTTS